MSSAERAWIIVSVLCLTAASVLLLRGNHNSAFVAAALGAVAWFLNYRSGIRQTINADEETDGTDEDDSDEYEEEQ